MEEREPEVEEARRDRLAIHEDVPLGQVPAARAHDQRRRLLAERVRLLRGLEADRPAHGVAQVRLALDDVRPRRRARVLEVGHEDACAGVQRVDHHLPVDRAGDLAAPVAEVGRRGRDRPVGLAHLPRLLEEVRPAATRAPPLEELRARGLELMLEALDERERLGREDGRVGGRRDGTHANCASSVEPVRARVELSPPETACATRSKYPAPTSRWWRVAV